VNGSAVDECGVLFEDVDDATSCRFSFSVARGASPTCEFAE
jgi:hypothetical protein